MIRHTMVPFWRDIRVLTFLGQVAFVLIVALVAGFLYANVSAAMTKRGLVAGLEFLNREAAFEIGETLIPYKPSDTYATAFLAGLANTLLVSVVGIFLSTILGVLIGVARLSTNWLINRLAAVYIEIIRNTPLLVQLIFIYFAVFLKLPRVSESIEFPGSIYASQRGLFLPRPEPSSAFSQWLTFIVVGVVLAYLVWKYLPRLANLQGMLIPWLASLLTLILVPTIGWLAASEVPLKLDVPVRGNFNFTGGINLSPEFSALLFGLVIYTAGFIAEVVRGGIQSVRRGQLEAGYALGLTGGQLLRLVIFPQALRVIVPPLTSQYLNLAKNSSLAIAIGFPDLFSVASTTANQTGAPVPVLTLVMITYLAMSLFTSLLMNIYNRGVQVLEK